MLHQVNRFIKSLLWKIASTMKRVFFFVLAALALAAYAAPLLPRAESLAEKLELSDRDAELAAAALLIQEHGEDVPLLKYDEDAATSELWGKKRGQTRLTNFITIHLAAGPAML